MVTCVIEDGWTIEATAERFQIDAKTVRKWRDRFLGSTGFLLEEWAYIQLVRPAAPPEERLSRLDSCSV